MRAQEWIQGTPQGPAGARLEGSKIGAGKPGEGVEDRGDIDRRAVPGYRRVGPL